MREHLNNYKTTIEKLNYLDNIEFFILMADRLTADDWQALNEITTLRNELKNI